jgi:hypothetical protein
MSKEHELTEKLKVIETDVYNDKIDLSSISRKLDIAYKYEDELIQRQIAARENTTKLRNDFFKKCGEISEKYDKIKNIVDIFTGNFHRHNIS